MQGIVETSHVFRWKRHQLHIAPEGLMLTRSQPLSGALTVCDRATIPEIKEVNVLPHGKRATLEVRLADGKDPWRLSPVPTAEAEWAAELIRGHVAGLVRAELPSFSQAKPLPELQTTIAELLANGDRQIVDLLDFLLLQGIFHRATDVHFEAFKESLAVRYRIDGNLREIAKLEPALARRLMTRLKVAARLAVYRRDVPQEGRILARARDRTVDLRVATLPTLYGEKAVVRIFDPSEGLLPLDRLGMSPATLDAFRQCLAAPQGTILLTGPSNSGKTTTLYAALDDLRRGERAVSSIATIEDPIEYDLEGVNQTQVNLAVGLTFATGLRTLLRQDPEVIMLGEIRDPETADIVIRAGLTGHLILTTLHAGSAGAVFVRLLDMGVEPYLLASSVTAVMSQLLVPLLCPSCRRKRTDEVPGHHAPGCAECEGTGLHGRTGVFELIPVDDALRQLVMQRAPAGEFEKHAAQVRVASLEEEQRRKVEEGLIPPESAQAGKLR